MSGNSRFKTWEEAVIWLRDQHEQVDLVNACYYDDPLVGAAERYFHGEEWQHVQHFLPRTCDGMRALDVGAGRGIASYALAREGFKVTALEPDASALVGADAIRSLAQETGLPIQAVQEFSERLPFPNAEFDVVFARAVLHHTRDLEAACRELHRVLKPGGLLLAVREHVISRPEDLPAFLEIHPLHRLYGGEHAFLLAEYQKALLSAGFRIEHQLAPLSSPINYAPQTRASLRQEIAQRLKRVPLLGFLAPPLLSISFLFDLILAAAALVDRRPGRLYSFVCRKPL